MGKVLNLEVMTVKIHPRYAGKIIEALELAQVTARKAPDLDQYSRVILAADYGITADIVGKALGAHIAKAPAHSVWGRWLARKVMDFAIRVHADPTDNTF